jgi:hypothetical protein
LLAIAAVAGGRWPSRARAALVATLATREAEEASYGIQLLAAVRAVMDGADVMSTEHLVVNINKDDELPFGGWNDGKGLDARTLAKYMKPFGVKPKVIRVGDQTPRGYRAEDLRDAWERYIPFSSPEAQQAQQAQHATPSATENPRNHGDVADVADVALVEGRGADVADEAATAAPDEPSWRDLGI